MWIIPSVIMPCFYEFKALDEDTLPENQKTLVSDLNSLAKELKFPLKKLFMMDGSKRSSHSNAFQYGFCGNKRIVLFDTLLNQASTEEIVAILAHELGHWFFSHTIRALITSEIQVFCLFYGFSLVNSNIYFFNQFGFTNQSTMIGLLLFMHLWSPVQSILVFLIKCNDTLS